MDFDYAAFWHIVFFAIVKFLETLALGSLPVSVSRCTVKSLHGTNRIEETNHSYAI